MSDINAPPTYSNQAPKPVKIFIPKPISQNKADTKTATFLKQLNTKEIEIAEKQFAMKLRHQKDLALPEPIPSSLLSTHIERKHERAEVVEKSPLQKDQSSVQKEETQQQIKIYVPEDSSLYPAENRRNFPNQLKNLSRVHGILVRLFNNEPVTIEQMDLLSHEVSIIFEFLFRKDKSLKPETM